jgi:hypothetical protein
MYLDNMCLLCFACWLVLTSPYLLSPWVSIVQLQRSPKILLAHNAIRLGSSLAQYEGHSSFDKCPDFIIGLKGPTRKADAISSQEHCFAMIVYPCSSNESN